MLRIAPFLLLLIADPPRVPQGHAHNDYEHPRPLLDALEHGFRSVEADIFFVDGKLLVAHNRIDLKPGRTLEKLYLDPLRARAKANGGQIDPKNPHGFYLLIDVKTDAGPTYAVLHDVLARYADMLTEVKDGKVTPRAVNVVISGNRDRPAMKKQPRRFAGLDGRPADLDSPSPDRLVLWISDSWGNHFKWKGDGPMPDDEKNKLRDFVARTGQQGRMLRFWGAPDKPAVWRELRDAGVDLINTDRLAELQEFLSTAPK